MEPGTIIQNKAARAVLSVLIHMAFAVMLVTYGVAAAQEASPPSLQGSPQKTVKISQFSTLTGPVRLTDASSAIDLFIPVAGSVVISDTVAEFRYTHSIALQGARSYLAIRLNEATLAQIPFDPAQPVANARVRLPAELWRTGYNKLTLAVVQHYTDNCEDPEAPELWTELDLFNSTLSYTTAPISSAPTLSDLAGLFSPGLGGLDRVMLLTAPDDTDQSLRAEALPLVAQALALRRQFAPLFVDYAPWRAREPVAEPAALPDQMRYMPPNYSPTVHVLVGTLDQLTRILPAETLKGINGPHLMIDHAGGNPRLIVTGPTPVDVIEASRVLAEMDDAVNPTANVSILSRDVNDRQHALVDRRVMQLGSIYSFAALGTATKTSFGTGSHKVPLKLPIPANFYTDESAHAELLVDFSYGAGMGPGSVLNVLLNGEYIHGLLLDNPNGAAFREYRISVPARRLLPGLNNVVFEVNLRPQAGGGDCISVKGRHLMAQILGSSTIELPSGGAVAIQPNLALFTATGFPYVAPSETAPKIIRITDSALMGSALTLIGKLAQVAQAPLRGWRIDIGSEYRGKGSAIVLGTMDTLPADLFASWSAALGRTSKWPYQALNDMRQSAASPSSGILDILLSGAGADEKPDVLRGSVTQDGGLGAMGAIAAFRNAYDSHASTITVITATDSDLLRTRMDELVQGEIWGQIDGHLAIWNGLTGPVTSMRVAEHFEVGDKDPWLWLRLVLSHNPWYWIGAVLAAILVAVVSARILLRRRRKLLEIEE